MQTSRVTAGHSTVRHTVSHRAGISRHWHGSGAGHGGGAQTGGGAQGGGGQPSPANAVGATLIAAAPTHSHANPRMLMAILLGCISVPPALDMRATRMSSGVSNGIDLDAP